MSSSAAQRSAARAKKARERRDRHHKGQHGSSAGGLGEKDKLPHNAWADAGATQPLVPLGYSPPRHIHHSGWKLVGQIPNNSQYATHCLDRGKIQAYSDTELRHLVDFDPLRLLAPAMSYSPAADDTEHLPELHGKSIGREPLGLLSPSGNVKMKESHLSPSSGRIKAAAKPKVEFDPVTGKSLGAEGSVVRPLFAYRDQRRDADAARKRRSDQNKANLKGRKLKQYMHYNPKTFQYY